MCYDVTSNKTLFNKDVMDGVYCTTAGLFANYNFPMCLVGGNCSLQGFDLNGDEKFWTVTGGNTVCMVLADVDGDGLNELIVGTDDYAIRFYKNENNISEINENTKIVLIHPIGSTKFIYGLENGAIGLYESGERVWRKKEKGVLMSCLSLDINEDGFDEILCGWSTGKLQMRKDQSGDVILELELNQEISKLFYDDLNNSSRRQVICCTSSGEVYGYVYSENDKSVKKEVQFVTKDKNISKEDIGKYEQMIEERKDILDKIEDLTIRMSNKSKINSPKDDVTLPLNTQVKIDLQSNNEAKCADLIIESTVGTYIKTIIVLSEQLYKGETYVQYPDIETNKVIIQIKTEKDMNINLHIKVLVGMSFYSKDFQVFEYNKIIPKYCFYILLRDDTQNHAELKQGIVFKVNERLERLILWLEHNFNIPAKELNLFKSNDNVYDVKFMSLRTDKVLQIYMKNNQIQIMSDEIELTGNILQDMCCYFKLDELDTALAYLETVEELNILIKRIERLDNIRNQFNINMAEIITFIKDLFVRAEDSRLLDNMQIFRDYFRKINIRNMELLDEFEKRTRTYEDLLSDLKKVNAMIQNFANLKVGSFKNKMISLCRDAIRTKNYKLLIKVVSTGSE